MPQPDHKSPFDYFALGYDRSMIYTSIVSSHHQCIKYMVLGDRPGISTRDRNKYKKIIDNNKAFIKSISKDILECEKTEVFNIQAMARFMIMFEKCPSKYNASSAYGSFEKMFMWHSLVTEMRTEDHAFEVDDE